MNAIKMLAVAAGLAGLAACGGNNAGNNADANASLENVDTGLTTTGANGTDLNATSDVNATTDVNATDLNAANANDANASSNASTNTAL
jgi:hypothetical protein